MLHNWGRTSGELENLPVWKLCRHQIRKQGGSLCQKSLWWTWYGNKSIWESVIGKGKKKLCYYTSIHLSIPLTMRQSILFLQLLLHFQISCRPKYALSLKMATCLSLTQDQPLLLVLFRGEIYIKWNEQTFKKFKQCYWSLIDIQ